MKQEAVKVIEKSKKIGWVMEPSAKDIFKLYKLPTTNYRWAKTEKDALDGAAQIGYPVVAKIVSPDIVHKTEVDGVAVGIKDAAGLSGVFKRLSRLKGFDGIIVEGMEKGVELIVGSKYDPQFGTVIMAGIGGTSVEIYKDVAIRMAPASKSEVVNALDSLEASELLHGFRGAKPVNMNKLTDLIVGFSKMAHDLSDYVESIDCNPVFAGTSKSIIADARFILK